jgi:hypothetical protein
MYRYRETVLEYHRREKIFPQGGKDKELSRRLESGFSRIENHFL